MVGKLISLNCEVCGKEYYKYPSQIKNNKHYYCSRECYLKAHSQNTPKCICEICGKEFAGTKYNANRFCSRECYNQWHNIKNKERECPVCHKIFIAKASEDKYCSWECYNKDRHMPKGKDHWNWQGGITSENVRLRNSLEYKTWQLDVYKRDHYHCCKCGSKENINAHHIYPWKFFPDKRFDVDNGITLCAKCHKFLHSQYSKDYKGPIILSEENEKKG